MINILYWSNYAALTRGGQKSLSYILRDIDRSKYQPVLVSQETGGLTDFANKLNIPTEVLKLPRLRPQNIIDIIKCIYNFWKLLKKYDVKIVHSEELLTVLYTAIFRLMLNIRTIWHVRVFWDTPLQKFVSLFISDRIICVSNKIAKSFPNSQKVFIVQNGIDVTEYDPNSPRLLSDKLKEGTTLIGYLNNLVQTKGTHILVQSIPYVVKLYPDVKYLIAGSGEKGFINYLVDLSKKSKVYENIIFWGEELNNSKELLNRFAIYIMPSFSEGMARGLLEAMALEKPIVASDTEENSELLTHNKTALLYRRNDPADLAEKTITLLKDTKFAEGLGKNARLHVSVNYTHKLTMDKIYSVYKDFKRSSYNDYN
ncbi:MAG: glycosyltransferase family 4 protein [Elusimicrobia bacterium]|nr:glycosyltransferase family 4 protein [Candidatus Liberimonas magnetica]